MIKISSFVSGLHETDEFQRRNGKLLESIEREAHEKLVFAPLDDYDADLKLIFIASGGSEGYFLKDIDKLRPPFYLLTSGGDNSLAASLEILTYLNANGYEGEVLHGTPQYVGGRIQELLSSDKGKVKKSTPKNSVIQAKTIDLGGKYGVLGKPSDWLIASIPDYDAVKRVFGTEILEMPLDELVAAYNSLPSQDEVVDGLDFGSAKRFVEAVNVIRERYNFDGITLRCFDLLDTLHTTGCLSLAHLNADGFIGACEGDVMSLLSMALVRKLTGQSSFMANPSRIDTTTNTILFAHCTVPFDMLSSFTYDTHFESGIGVAVKGQIKEGPVTVFRVSKDLKSYFVAEGVMLRNLSEKDLCRTQIEVRLDDGEHTAAELLIAPCGNHHIIFYGRHKKEIDALLGN